MLRIKNMGYRQNLCLAALLALAVADCGGDLRMGSSCYAWGEAVCSFWQTCGLSRAGFAESKDECIAAEKTRCLDRDDSDGEPIGDCIDEIRSQTGTNYATCPASPETLLSSGDCSDLEWASTSAFYPYPEAPVTNAPGVPNPNSTLPSTTPNTSSAPSASTVPGVTPAGSTCSSASAVSRNAIARNEDGTGEVTQSSVCVPGLGTISKITLRYNMDSFFGELTRQAVFAYNSNFSIAYATWFAQVFTTSGQELLVSGLPVFVGWEEGVWPPPGGSFGSDTTGSPAWSQVFGRYSSGTAFSSYLDEATAKTIYNNGFTLDRLRMVEVNGKAVVY